jgi:putative addiction module killer protein
MARDMIRRKKQNVSKISPPAQEQDEIIRLRFGGKIVELTPTLGQPIHVLQAEAYEVWVESIRDIRTNTRINSSVDRMRRGLFGDWKEIGVGVFEMRLDFGPGYRVYYAKYGKVVIVLLGGVDKSSQQKDITRAVGLWEESRNEITQI